MWLQANRIDLRKLDIPENKFMTLADGTKIAYKEMGKGKPVFCIPPWPSGSTVYVPFGEAVKEHLKVIAIDLPGWGGYSDRLNGKPTIENYCAVIAEFINHFGFDDYSIVGYSFGGALTQALLKFELIKPQKVAYVSTIHSGDDLANANKSTLMLYKVAKSLFVPNRVIKKMTELYIGKLSRRHKDAYYSHYNDNKLHAAIVEENLRGDLSSIFGVLFSLVEAELLNVNEAKPESIVIYADTDPEFIKKESREVADFLDIEPIYLEHIDHDHFVFDVNKSTDILLNFFLA